MVGRDHDKHFGILQQRLDRRTNSTVAGFNGLQLVTGVLGVRRLVWNLGVYMNEVVITQALSSGRNSVREVGGGVIRIDNGVAIHADVPRQSG